MIFTDTLKNFYEIIMRFHENDIINRILRIDNLEKIKNTKIKNINNIAIVISSIKKFAGGHTSLLRLGTYLSEKNINITYVYIGNDQLKKIEKNAYNNVGDLKGNFIKYEDAQNNSYDVVIATSWISVYWAKHLNGYKVYFVQDFEPYFFKVNERYLLAKKTYELGFHVISLGKWNLKQITKNCNLCGKYDYIDFPYEKKEYEYVEREFENYKNKKTIYIATYIKEEGKRIPNLIQNILLNVTNELKKEKNIELKVLYFGLNKKYKVRSGKNLGKLNKIELNKLYQFVDFGMVASMTNISLVPYEMIATGLPIIEFEDGSFTDFFEKDSAILIDFNAETLYKKIVYYIENPIKIYDMQKKSYDTIKDLSWKNSIDQFYNLLLKEKED